MRGLGYVIQTILTVAWFAALANINGKALGMDAEEANNNAQLEEACDIETE